MGYSKIKEVEVFNFMSFKHARLVFDETNILNLKGYNDSGKSAILRAVVVCLTDMYKRAQNKYIRYGADYFRVVVTFDDGISIMRDKYMNGQSLYEMYKNGECIYTTKQGNRLTRIEGVPKTISDYLGLCVTENGCLNYQSCSDRLLLVETTGSENYQELNSVLKSNEISRATALINSDRNEMNSKMIEMENEFNSNKAVLQSRSDVDEYIIGLVQEREEFSELIVGMKTDLEAIKGTITSLKEVKQIPEVSEIETGRLSDVERLVGILGKLEKVQVLPKVEKLDVERLSSVRGLAETLSELSKVERIPKIEKVEVDKVKDIMGILSTLKRCSELPEKLPVVDQVNKVNAEKYTDLVKIIKEMQTLEQGMLTLGKITQEKADVQRSLDSIIENARSQGIELYQCSHCGAYSEVPHSH